MRKFTLALAVAAMTASAAMAQNYTLNPAPGVATDLQGIVLTFPTEKVGYYENSRFPIAVLENTTTGAVYYCQDPDLNDRAMVDGSEYTLVFIEESSDEAEAEISQPGNYVLTIRGLYTGELEDAVDLDVITENYTINYPAPYTLSPAAGVATDLQGIVLTFTADKVGFYENNRMPVATLENLTTGKVYNCADADRNAKAETDGAAYTLVFLGEDDEEAPVAINEPGEYLLTVKGMYVGEIGEEVGLPVITANYTVEYPCAYTLAPEPGVATDLQGIILSFEATGVAFYENNKMPVAVLENTTTGAVYSCFEADRNTFTTAGTEFVLYFVSEDYEEGDDLEAINVPGNYKLTVSALYVGENEDLPVITADYVIEYPVAYELSPVAGSSVECLQNISEGNYQTIVLSFPDEFVGFYENNKMPIATLVNNTTGVEYNCYEADRNTKAEAAASYNLVFLDEDDEAAYINVPGEYTLTIKGMWTGDEEDPTDLPAIVAKYVVVYPVEYLLDPANGATVGEISKVTIDFYNNKNVVFLTGNISAAVITNGQEGDYEVAYVCQEPTMDPRAESEGRVYDLVFTNENDELVSINVPGMWYLTIRSLALETLDEATGEYDYEDLPVINAVYYVDGEPGEGDTSKVVDLTSPEGVYNVYSVNGTQVVKNGSVDALKALGKGIYVINGHKVVIK
ncbi:MAG: hypothetical protein J1F67_06210 [Muribaculaceae bacterium]|nr:hypothetical protein [Muribaculaceae bacterium]